MRRALVELRVRDLGVVEDVTVRLGPGMTALTGETGAGKTLLVGALALLLGGRADGASVRAGADEALVEARFSVVDPDDGAGADGHDGHDDVVLARSVPRTGRSRAWIDGRMASLAMLGEAAGELLELHGQHEHRTLVRSEAQRAALDAAGGVDVEPWAVARRRLSALEHEREDLGGDAQHRARQADLLRFQRDEITAAAIEDADEDARLATEEDRLGAASAHREAAVQALAALVGSDDDGALDRLATASAALAGRAPLAELEGRVRGTMAEVADLVGELRRVADTWEDDPERLDEIRARRTLFRQLGRKYGDTLADVLAFAEGVDRELAELEATERRAARLDGEVRAARLVLDQAAAEVGAARRAAAPALGTAVEATLRELAMPSARFTVAVAGEDPADDVTFLLAANPGEPEAALARAASGGELARTMLAIRLALSDAPGVMVFDEVDAGVGGEAAVAVGRSLARLARHGQVLVVTHLPQVAAQAHHHLRVRKVEAHGRTTSEIDVLSDEDRVVELSRMLSGSPDSDAARRHARELLATGSGPAAEGPPGEGPPGEGPPAEG